MKFLCSGLMFIARILIATVFISAGVGKLMNYEQTSLFMIAHGFTMVPFFLFGAAAIELFFGVLLVLGCKTWLASFVLIAFMIPTTIIFHNFWISEGMERGIAEIMFFKNLAIIGGLTYILCQGAGGWACDRCKCDGKKPEQQPEIPKQ